MKTENYLYKHLNQNIFRKILNRIILNQISGTKGIYIEKNVKFLRYKKQIVLGNNLIIKEGCRLCCTNPNANLTIGNNSSIGHQTFIFCSQKIVIGNDCDCTILLFA